MAIIYVVLETPSEKASSSYHSYQIRLQLVSEVRSEGDITVYSKDVGGK